LVRTTLDAKITSDGALTRTQIDLVTTEINDEAAVTRATIESVGEEIETVLTGGTTKVTVSTWGGLYADAADRLRVCQPYTIFESKLVNDKQPLFYDEIVNGTATSTHNAGGADASSVSMVVNASGDYVIRQTKMRFNYQAYKTAEIALTGILGAVVADTESMIGYYNTSTAAPYTANKDGIMWGRDATGVYVAVFRDGTEIHKTYQTSWNLDKMDGAGASGMTLNPANTNIFIIQFLWLGVDGITFGMKMGTRVWPVHRFNYANTATSVYMATPNHSVRYEIRSTGGVSTMKQICSAVISNGGVEESGVTRSISNGIASITVGNVMEGILFYRVNSNRPCTTVQLQNFGILNTATATNNFRYAIILNPTIGGTALTWATLANSAIDYAVGVGDNTLTGGTYLTEGYVTGALPQTELKSNLVIRPGLSINGAQDVIALAIQTFTGTDTFVGEMDLLELTCG
jgi:hypothetical protein